MSAGSSATSATVGKTITITVRISTSGQAINAADGTLVFPSSLLTLQSISRSGSIFNFWAEEPHGSNASGQISFSGGLPSPGYTGNGGRLFQATFKTKAVGSAAVTLSGVHILANDGYGTNVFSGAGSTTITISEESDTPTPPSNPTEPAPVISSNTAGTSTWSKTTTPTLTWTKPKNYLGSSIVVDQQKNTVPGTSVTTTSGSFTPSITTDGIWYIHIRHSYSTGWSTTTTIVFRRDTTAPEPFSINIERDRGESDPTPTLSFTAKDATSSIAQYTLVIDDGASTVISSPHTLKNISSGTHHIVVTAIDQAGNKREAEATITITGYSTPIISAVSSPIVLLDTITVRGTAIAGDTITLLLDGQPFGQTVAGKENPTAAQQGITVTAPWFFTSDQLVKPGRHTITASAMAVDGRTSVASDPVTILVTGTSIVIGGRPIATIAFAPVAGLVVILLILINTAFLVRIWMSFRQLYRREVTVEEELEALRRRIGRERVTADEVDRELYQMELDLAGKSKRTTTRKTRKRRTG
jgi:hypothetical protein